jgi:hypothetical protein
MIKVAVDIDKWRGTAHFYLSQAQADDKHAWAFNYLTAIDMLVLLLAVYKNKRCKALPDLLVAKGIKDAPIYCNAKGQVVFYWSSPSDHTFFLMKWS